MTMQDGHVDDFLDEQSSEMEEPVLEVLNAKYSDNWHITDMGHGGYCITMKGDYEEIGHEFMASPMEAPTGPRRLQWVAGLDGMGDEWGPEMTASPEEVAAWIDDQRHRLIRPYIWE